MYYQCKQCNKTWYYPIEKCIFCHKPVTEVIPTRFTIEAVTEVQVASREHPKVPYFVLLLRDENGQTHSLKTFKQYKEGDNLEPESSAGIRHAVLASRVKYSLKEAFSDLIRLQGETGLKPDMKVIIKLSLSKPAAYNSGEVSNAQLVKLLCSYLLELGLKKDQIILAERIPASEDQARILAKTDIAKACSELGIEFINLQEQQHETISQGGVLFDLPKVFLGADLVISLAPLMVNLGKDNAPASQNLANIFPGQVSANLSKLGQKADDILPPVLSLIDAQNAIVLADSGKSKRELGALFLSDDYLALDKALVELYHLPQAGFLVNRSFQLVGSEFDLLSTNLV